MGNPYYLLLLENRTKPGTVLNETVLSGNPLYILTIFPNFHFLRLLKIFLMIFVDIAITWSVSWLKLDLNSNTKTTDDFYVFSFLDTFKDFLNN